MSTFKFDLAKVQALAEHALEVLVQVRMELLSFADFLEQQAQREE